MVFLVALFVIKNDLIFRDKAPGTSSSLGFAYDGESTVEELVMQDTDQDGILDWEEKLWGLDPSTTETTPGIPDSSAVVKIKAAQGYGEANMMDSEENLTRTDKFSRELFSTVASLNENGVMDESAVEKITESMVLNIKDVPQRKIYTSSDLKVTTDESPAAVKKYTDTLNNVHKFYPINGDVVSIMQRFVVDENNVDETVLEELKPIITQLHARINGMLKVEVPASLSPYYLELLNAGEGLVENMEDILLFGSDPVVALGGISKYEENTARLENAVIELMNAANKGLRN